VENIEQAVKAILDGLPMDEALDTLIEKGFGKYVGTGAAAGGALGAAIAATRAKKGKRGKAALRGAAKGALAGGALGAAAHLGRGAEREKHLASVSNAKEQARAKRMYRRAHKRGQDEISTIRRSAANKQKLSVETKLKKLSDKFKPDYGKGSGLKGGREDK